MFLFRRKIAILLAAVLLIMTGCSKEEEMHGPAPLKQEGSREAIIRIALEGIAMLEEEGSTRSAAGRRVNAEDITCRTVPSTRSDEGADTLYYVVNFEDDAGFALVAADEKRPNRLLAVTEQGSYEAGTTSDNEGFNLYVTLLDQSLISGPDNDWMPIDTTAHDLGEYYAEDYYSDWISKGPYVQVKWGQGCVPFSSNYPYNMFCYENSQDLLCPAGCVTVAIAQIMSYHQKPSSYKITFDGSKQMREFNWEFTTPCIGGIGYPWMNNYLVATELARLFREIGKRASMTYTPTESSATIFGARESFASFGYDQNPQRAYKYADVKTELDAGRPVWMSGQADGTDKNGNPIKTGHAWVVDGYKQRYHYFREYVEHSDGSRDYYINETTLYGYIHINWGYDGRNNGYFQGDTFELADAYEYDSASDNYLSEYYQYSLQILTGIWNDDIE